MHSYLIFQRPINSPELQETLELRPNSPEAKAYFDLIRLGMGKEAEPCVTAAVEAGLYVPTMFMSATGSRNRQTLEDIFDEGNGHGTGALERLDICRHPSMSVGDLVVGLVDKTVTVCMANGWHELSDIDLNLQCNQIGAAQ